METARIIVCEKTGCWAVALRRELSVRRRVFETRSLDECRQELAAHPASFVLLELRKTNVAAMLEMLDWLSRQTHVRAAVAGDRGLEPWAALVREAGAIDATFSPRAMRAVARLVERHLTDVEPLIARQAAQQSPLDQIRSRLPWPLRQ